jgi:hypothetical protein
VSSPPLSRALSQLGTKHAVGAQAMPVAKSSRLQRALSSLSALMNSFACRALCWRTISHRDRNKGRRSPVLRQLSNQSGTPNNSEMARCQRFSLTTPNPPKQLEDHSWLAGYADGYIDGLEEAWTRINAEIERAPPSKRGKNECRIGLLLACKLIALASCEGLSDCGESAAPFWFAKVTEVIDIPWPV